MEENLKHLLLKDLCARLPYGVKVEHLLHAPNNPSELFGVDVDKQILYCDHKGREEWYKVDFIKPYLRPMSSMTEEEKNYIDHRWGADNYGNITTYSSYEGGVSEIELADIVGFQDWLNKNMFDYRGLIEKGLAIEVTEENNPYKD